MRKVAIAGVGMSQFGKQIGRGLRSLSMEAVEQAFKSSGLAYADVNRIYFGNAIAGTVVQQDMIKGQVVFRGHPLGKLPLINVENACASGGSAFLLAVEAVASGCADVVLAVGTEQMNHVDRNRAFNALRGATDIDDIGEIEPGTTSANSVMMDYYAGVAQSYLDTYGASAEDFARVAVKNRRHAELNPLAHMRTPQTIEDVMNARMIVPPLTLPMCSPVTDGSAAILVCSLERAKTLNVPTVLVRVCMNASGASGEPVADSVRKAVEFSGVATTDCDLFELHDAAAPAELTQYHEIGLCPEGDGFKLIREGVTDAGGRYPVNLSGGLLSRGHPLGATGAKLTATLLAEMPRRNARYGLVTMCIGGGQGIAAIFERCV